MNGKTDRYADQLRQALDDALSRAGDGYYIDDLRWYSFPQTWPSTSGMQGGPGGQAMTTIQTVAVFVDNQCHVYCGGGWVYSLAYGPAIEYVRALEFPAKAKLNT